MEMMRLFKCKFCTADEAVSMVESGSRVYVSGNAATPYPLIEALARRKDELTRFARGHHLI